MVLLPPFAWCCIRSSPCLGAPVPSCISVVFLFQLLGGAASFPPFGWGCFLIDLMTNVFKFKSVTCIGDLNSSLFKRATAPPPKGGRGKHHHQTRERRKNSSTLKEMRKTAPPKEGRGQAAPTIRGEEENKKHHHPHLRWEEGNTTPKKLGRKHHTEEGKQHLSRSKEGKWRTAPTRGRGARQHHPQEKAGKVKMVSFLHLLGGAHFTILTLWTVVFSLLSLIGGAVFLPLLRVVLPFPFCFEKQGKVEWCSSLLLLGGLLWRVLVSHLSLVWCWCSIFLFCGAAFSICFLWCCFPLLGGAFVPAPFGWWLQV